MWDVGIPLRGPRGPRGVLLKPTSALHQQQARELSREQGTRIGPTDNSRTEQGKQEDTSEWRGALAGPRPVDTRHRQLSRFLATRSWADDPAQKPQQQRE